MLDFILKGLKFFKKLIKICITYGCILFCGCLKEKCIDDNDNEPEGLPFGTTPSGTRGVPVIGSPTPLKSDIVKHPILEAYEENIINKIKSNDN